MSDLEEKFQDAAKRVKTLDNRPSNDYLLMLYSYFKQATVGPVNTSQPWAIQIEARAKWDAWKKQETLSKDEAMSKYIDVVNELIKAS